MYRFCVDFGSIQNYFAMWKISSRVLYATSSSIHLNEFSIQQLLFQNAFVLIFAFVRLIGHILSNTNWRFRLLNTRLESIRSHLFLDSVLLPSTPHMRDLDLLLLIINCAIFTNMLLLLFFTYHFISVRFGLVFFSVFLFSLRSLCVPNAPFHHTHPGHLKWN